MIVHSVVSLVSRTSGGNLIGENEACEVELATSYC